MKRFIFILSFAVLLSFPYKSQAFVSFGGFNLWAVPCTCSAGTVWYVWYTPLYLNSIVPTAGALAVGIPPKALWYANFDPIVPTTWSLGKFMPGVQSCLQPSGTGCSTWPVLGHVYEVGSSLPPAALLKGQTPAP